MLVLGEFTAEHPLELPIYFIETCSLEFAGHSARQTGVPRVRREIETGLPRRIVFMLIVPISIMDDNLVIYNRSGLNEDPILNLMSGNSAIEYLGITREEQVVSCRYYLALLSSLHECGI